MRAHLHLHQVHDHGLYNHLVRRSRFPRPASLSGSHAPWVSSLASQSNQGSQLGQPLLCQRDRFRSHLGSGSPASLALSQSTSAAANDDEDDTEGELHAVDTAIRANALIFAAKLAVYFVSSSSAMLAEAVHSLVDIANQTLLRVGIMKAQKQPNEVHPYGYSRDQFIWPLISAVGIFCCGAGISLIHGVQSLFETHELGDLYWNFVVLGVSGILESHSLWVAVQTLKKRASNQAMSLWEYIKTGADPAAVAVMMEDGAAVAGLVIAAGCLGLCQATGAVVWDAVGSIAVSLLLGGVAVVLIQRNRKWLIGKSMPKAQEEQILEYLEHDRVIKGVHNIKSEELGVRQYRFQADIAFDGEELARRCLDRCGRVRLFRALDAAVRRHDPHALDALLMQFAAVIVSTTGAEVDRLEREIMRMVPGTKYVDLETDRGRPTRAATAFNPGASKPAAQMQQISAALQEGAEMLQREAVARSMRGPLDAPLQEGDHLADLVEYPLGSLSSFEGLDETPDWIQELQQQQQQAQGAAAAAAATAAAAAAAAAAAGAKHRAQQEQQQEQLLPGVFGAATVPEIAAAAAAAAAVAAAGGRADKEVFVKEAVEAYLQQAQQRQLQPQELGLSFPEEHLMPWEHIHGSSSSSSMALGSSMAASSSSSSSGGSSIQEADGSIRALHAIEDQLIGDTGEYKPFCESMYASLGFEGKDKGAAAGLSRVPRPRPSLEEGEELSLPGGFTPAFESGGSSREQNEEIRALHDLEEALNRDQKAYKPFCENMYQQLHGKNVNNPVGVPPQPPLQQQQQQKRQQAGGASSQQLTDMEAVDGAAEPTDNGRRANLGG